MNELFRKVKTIERKPDESGNYLTDIGYVDYDGKTKNFFDEDGRTVDGVAYWFEPVEIPTDEVIRDKWISVEERLPDKKEQLENWKFLVANINDNWLDSAYYVGGKWNNGECEVIPTHWQPLPEPPKGEEK